MSGSGGWLTNGVQKVQPFTQNGTTAVPTPATLVGSSCWSDFFHSAHIGTQRFGNYH